VWKAGKKEGEKLGKSKVEGWGGRGERGIRRTNSFMDWICSIFIVEKEMLLRMISSEFK